MTRREEPRMMTMREFRNTFPELREPVRVVRARGTIEVVGTWTPSKERLNGQVRRGDEGIGGVESG